MLKCMKDHGWDSVIDYKGGGGVVTTSPQSQDSAVSRDEVSCARTAGYDTPAQLTPDQFLSYYKLYAKGVTCLIAHGVDVPRPVSFQTYSDHKGDYYVYKGVSLARPDIHVLQAACPEPTFTEVQNK